MKFFEISHFSHEGQEGERELLVNLQLVEISYCLSMQTVAIGLKYQVIVSLLEKAQGLFVKGFIN